MGNVTVTVAIGSLTLPAAGPGQFTYLPAITSINPPVGSPSVNTRVTITGAGFAPGATVMFGSTPAVLVKVRSSTEIIAASPFGTPGQAVAITVTVGTLSSVPASPSADLFTYK